ncbi:benzoate 1,2-dioxygenase electron transfer component BenC [Mobilicoccus massiliensis]|uniref:benzoate 1,2-dioxygenase electron transfer component BenC n=1 Tax=Mobilicoccus massiliensis TaxID=1522310 RepID=UPI00058EC175|nr:benzoate 1,2-dioxygenase electron transfer component BenC [Mobilicoccus massiliensis]
MSHQVALSFEDGVTKFITCAEGQTVADASYRSRINIPLDCRDGACGTCKAFCEAGEYDPGFYIEDALTEDEAESGYCLPCQMKPTSDLVLQIASTSAVAKTRAATFTGTLTGLERLSPTTFALTVTTPDRDELAFLPGQYINFSVPGTQETRSYSFSNGPDEDELTFLVKITPGGVMSTYLTERAAEGDEVTFTGPNGSFFLREGERPLLLLAGGTGLAPILSILRRLVSQESTRPVHLIYGATTDDDVIELETIEELGSKLESFTWDYCVADKGSSARNIGYVTALIASEHLHDGQGTVYLCGPPAMVEAVRTHFSDNGMEPGGFYYEKFALSGAAASTSTSVTADEQAAVDDTDTVESAGAEQQADQVTSQAPDSSAPIVRAGGESELTVFERASGIAGQDLFGEIDMEPLGAPAGDAELETADTASRIAGQAFGERFDAESDDVVGRGSVPGGTALLLHDDGTSVTGQVFAVPTADVDPLVEPSPRVAAAPTPVSGRPAAIGAGGYEIGEEHPDITKSDAVFDARQALELGAVELTVGRLSSSQLAGYRLLADATLPYVEGERFVDPAAYTETNAAFHEYLFTLTGNEHLLQAYQALGVKGHMAEVLRNATWCDPEVAHDHVKIVEAFEGGDRERVRALVIEHAQRSKTTMRRAMADAGLRVTPAFITPGRFEGKVVLVTGAAQGIGEVTARRISAEGGRVVLADRSELVDGLAEELRSAARQATSVVGDLETYEGAQAAVAAAVDQFGRLDVAIHTVGGTIWAKPFHEYPADQIEAEINRSLYPTLWGCRAASEQMVKQGQGVIVNVSSVATRGVHRVPYSAAKGGVNAITASLALELAPHGIRVVATAPGGTDAPARRIPRGPAPEGEQELDWYQAIVDQTVSSSLLKRYGTLDEQASALCFVASDEASYITGTVLPVAGGDLG